MTHEGIDTTNGRFVAAMRERDAAAVAAVYAEDATLLAPAAEAITGQNAIEEYWRAAFGMGVREVELETRELEHADGSAYEVGAYRLHIEPEDGRPVTDVGKYVVIHKRQADGSWKWAVDIFNSNAAPA